jgi:hypothetical protein
MAIVAARLVDDVDVERWVERGLTATGNAGMKEKGKAGEASSSVSAKSLFIMMRRGRRALRHRCPFTGLSRSEMDFLSKNVGCGTVCLREEALRPLGDENYDRKLSASEH